MAATPLLDENSLGRTLCALEEARLAGRSTGDADVTAALGWVAGRYRQPGSYANLLFAPTPLDIAEKLALPTGEGGRLARAGTAHALGEEAARTLARWDYDVGWDRQETLEAILRCFRQSLSTTGSWRSARFCCHPCSVARWRALAAGRPAGTEEVLADAVRWLAEAPRTSNGRWRSFPFYYTVAALAEFETEAAQPIRAELRPAAERALSRLRGDGPADRARRRALDWILA